MKKTLTQCIRVMLFLIIISGTTKIANAQINSSSTWIWVNGDSTTEQLSIYGTKGVADASNKPGARYFSIKWNDTAGNLWLFGGYGYPASGSKGYLNDLWKYTTATGQWTWVNGDSTADQSGVYGTLGVSAPSNKPGGRYLGMSWTDAIGNLWLFGGQTSNWWNDLWKYDITTGQWTWVNGSKFTNATGTYGTLGTPAAANKPGARVAGTTWADAAGDLWLWGGQGYTTSSSSSGYLNDLWKYNVTTGQWTWVSGDNTINRSGVYGTLGIAATGNKPGGRVQSNSWVDASGNLWLFGGNGFDATGTIGRLNDLWKYNITVNQWMWVSGDKTKDKLGVYGIRDVAATGNKPGGREQSISWIDTAANLWFFGGYGYAASGTFNALNDLWKYNISAGQWTWVKGDTITNQSGVYGTKGVAAASNKPGCRQRSISWADNAGGLWFFGGYGYATNGSLRLLNDVWKISAGCLGSSSITTQTACGSYAWGGQTYTNSGVYTQTGLTNAAGCDSTATLNLTIKIATSSTTSLTILDSQLPYSWNGLTFNTAGTQTAHLTNAGGCDSAATLNLTVTAACVPTASSTSVSVCTSALPYNWNGLTFNAAGTQTAHLTNAGGCDSAATLIVTTKASPTVSSITNGTINVTTATLCILGSTTPYFNATPYGVWSSNDASVTSVIGGSQSGVVTANTNGTAIIKYAVSNAIGCSSSASLLVTVAQQAAPNAITGASSVCAGKTATLSSTTAGGVWASLNDKGTINASGVYAAANAGGGQVKYTVTNASGCTAFATKGITVNAIPAVPTIGYAPGTNPALFTYNGNFCKGKSFTAMGTPAGGTWAYTNPLVGTISPTGVVNLIEVGSGAVVYTYADANGCSNSRTFPGTVAVCPMPKGVNTVDGQQSTVNEFSMYPNPAKGSINLNIETLIGKGSIVVTDLYGKALKTQPLSIGTNRVDIATLTKGFYLVSMITSEGKTTKKLIVE